MIIWANFIVCILPNKLNKQIYRNAKICTPFVREQCHEIYFDMSENQHTMLH